MIVKLESEEIDGLDICQYKPYDNQANLKD